MALTRAGLDIQFGCKNITEWADLNNSGNSIEINARINYALAWAPEEMASRISGGRPLPTTTSVVVENVQYKLAGIWLYESRGIPDQDAKSPVAHHKQWVNQWFKDYSVGAVGFESRPGPFSF